MFLFYLVVCAAVWLAHGQLMRFSGITTTGFARLALTKFRRVRRLRDPERYDFSAPRVDRRDLAAGAGATSR